MRVINDYCDVCGSGTGFMNNLHITVKENYKAGGRELVPETSYLLCQECGKKVLDKLEKIERN